MVELIIVIAIIAVLAAVLAPQYIKYVEKSRVSVDENTVSEVSHAAEVAIADEKIYDSISATVAVTVKNSGTGAGGVATGGIGCDNPTLLAELKSVCGNTITLKSNTYKDKTYTFHVVYTAASGTTPASVAVVTTGTDDGWA
ncbi:MAG TPA: hypothetical protein PLD83_08500 [Oscillospiraceae bacterium]|nr:hypothetical protein [Oscillospiraceae bacterium]